MEGNICNSSEASEQAKRVSEQALRSIILDTRGIKYSPGDIGIMGIDMYSLQNAQNWWIGEMGNTVDCVPTYGGMGYINLSFKMCDGSPTEELRAKVNSLTPPNGCRFKNYYWV